MAMSGVANLARNSEGIQTAIGVLTQRFGSRVSTSASVCEHHGHTTTYLPNQPPDAVIEVTSTDEVAQIVKICATHHVPVIAYGTGTSLEGGVNAPAGGICIDMRQMNKIIAVHSEDLDVHVEAGVTREQLNTHLRDQGLFFPIDPGANASLGGMAATRASGTNAVRYGTMRDNVVNVTAVLADGQIIQTASRSRKSSAGYDLTRLLVGSEGTLGIITELTLRLQGIPEAMSAAICSFDSVKDACDATICAMQTGIPMARIELMDSLAVAAVNAYSKASFSVSPLLLLEFHGSQQSVDEQAKLFGEIAQDCGGSDFEWVNTQEERNRLWKARHDAYWAMVASARGKQMLTTDVCVPISKLAICVQDTQNDIAEQGLYGPIVGHVGDGNFHAAVAVDPDDNDEVAKVEGVSKRLVERAIAMEGTCTGEHGIGQGKRDYMILEHGSAINSMIAIKKAMDPHNILNPGKVVPE